ncbi:hypothetical protein SAM19_05347 [Brevibacillus laterosporus]|nr:hypothetical protein [Brevibacillus laterosporus]
MLPLRNDYVKFLEAGIDSGELEIETIITVFEKLYEYTQPSSGTSSYEIQFDHFKFFIHELFIYTSLIYLEKRSYADLTRLLTTEYFVKNRFNEVTAYDFTVFKFYIRSLDEIRNTRLDLRKFSVHAHLLVERSTLKKYPKSKLIAIDKLLYYLSAILISEEGKWFPNTYIYAEYRSKIEFLQRCKSRIYFEKAKILFNVTTEKEFREIIIGFNNEYQRGYRSGTTHIEDISFHISPEDVCSTP